MSKQFFKYIIIPLTILFVAIQFFRPERNEGELNLAPFIAETNASKEVVTILKKACTDCHSNKTNYPWYSNIAPFSFKISSHVIEGKDELNFSEWSTFSVKRKEYKMDEIVEFIEKKEMPLQSYLLMHKEAFLTKDEVKMVINWAKENQKTYQEELKKK